MASSRSWIGIDTPTEWGPLFLRAGKIALIGFVVLQAKEYFDAGKFDTAATSVDAILIAAGTLLLDAILKWAKV